jgi:hypothetical protein
VKFVSYLSFLIWGGRSLYSFIFSWESITFLTRIRTQCADEGCGSKEILSQLS